MTNNNFEVAVRNKMRFPFKGLVSVEDLWDLSVENLDSVFKTLNSHLKTVKEESLLNTKTKADKELDIKIEIVKYIVGIKLAEKEAHLNAKTKREEKQKLFEVLSRKENEELESKSTDEIKAMIEALGD